MTRNQAPTTAFFELLTCGLSRLLKMWRIPRRMKAKNPKMMRGTGQLNLLCKNANFKGYRATCGGGAHGGHAGPARKFRV